MTSIWSDSPEYDENEVRVSDVRADDCVWMHRQWCVVASVERVLDRYLIHWRDREFGTLSSDVSVSIRRAVSS